MDNRPSTRFHDDTSRARCSRRALLGVAASLIGGLSAPALFALPAAGTDPLPSWSDGPVKRNLLKFIADTSDERGARFVRAEERIAVFDNDGTLWCEQPTIEIAFIDSRVKALLAARPELRQRRPYSLLASGDHAALAQLQDSERLQLLADTHTGMTEDELRRQARHFLTTTPHPRFGVPFTQVCYLPQLELLSHLRARGFGVWISSGGELAFMRSVADDVYGVPPERVIGTYFADSLEERDGKLTLRRTDRLLSVNDKDGKPVNIQQRIGRRPILAVGNERSGGDIAMLRYTLGGSAPSLALLIDHDDAEREYSYDERDGASLAAAKRYGFTVVSMKRDWRQVFAFQR